MSCYIKRVFYTLDKNTAICFQRAMLPIYTVQTVDLILLCIGCIPQLHFCIEKKILLKSLCWPGGKFMLSSLQASWDRALVRISNLTKNIYQNSLKIN